MLTGGRAVAARGQRAPLEPAVVALTRVPLKHLLFKKWLALGCWGIHLCAVAAVPSAGGVATADAAPQWVHVPPGVLAMGGCTPVVGALAGPGACGRFHEVLGVERPRHVVKVPAFAMARTEVTLAQFKRFMAAAGRADLATPAFWRHNAYGDAAPVTHVSWQDAQDYIAWLNQTQGPGHRLPTEAEWEHACRAGADPTFCGGEEARSVAWTLADQQDQPSPVATKTPNPWGLHDLSGNVWEWTQDCWNTSYQGAPTDGSAWEDGDCTGRVARGGSWNEPPANARSTMRFGVDVGARVLDVGFRVVRDVSPLLLQTR